MSPAEQEHFDHVAGSASEFQNCFEEATLARCRVAGEYRQAIDNVLAAGRSQMKRQLTVKRLPHPEHSGDWHDKPLRWIAECEDKVFTQKFSTRRHAEIWASCARRADSFKDAMNRWDVKVV